MHGIVLGNEKKDHTLKLKRNLGTETAWQESLIPLDIIHGLVEGFSLYTLKSHSLAAVVEKVLDSTSVPGRSDCCPWPSHSWKWLNQVYQDLIAHGERVWWPRWTRFLWELVVIEALLCLLLVSRAGGKAFCYCHSSGVVKSRLYICHAMKFHGPCTAALSLQPRVPSRSLHRKVLAQSFLYLWNSL